MDRIPELADRLRRIQFQINQLMETVSKEVPLSSAAIQLVNQLAEKEVMKVSDISDFFGFTSGAATGITDKLTQAGLAKKERSDEDRRIVYVTLTEQGKTLAATLKQKEIHLHREVFGNSTDAQIEQMIASLTQIACTMEKHVSEH